MRRRITILFFTTALLTLTGFKPAEPNSMVNFLKEYLEIKYPVVDFNTFIYVAVKRQKMFVVSGDSILQSYTISTATKGLGSSRGSYQTPEGLHKIAEKVGNNLPANTIIKHKVATSETATIITEPSSNNQDLITSRVFHLKGMEDGLNTGEGHDSYNRGIFIHGTHEEGLLGTPASKGCIRMANKDVIDLFENVEVGTFVVILNN